MTNTNTKLLMMSGIVAATVSVGSSAFAMTVDYSPWYSGDPSYLTFSGCGVARGDNIDMWLDQDSDCSSNDPEHDDSDDISCGNYTAGVSLRGTRESWGGACSGLCSDAGTGYYLCAYDNTTGASWSSYVGVMPQCTQ